MDNYLKDGLYKESMRPVERTFTGTNVDDTVAKLIKKIHEADKDKQREAIEYIEGQLEDGYIDLSGIHEELELEIVKKAIQEYKKNHNIKTINDKDHDLEGGFVDNKRVIEAVLDEDCE